MTDAKRDALLLLVIVVVIDKHKHEKEKKEEIAKYNCRLILLNKLKDDRLIDMLHLLSEVLL